MAFKDNIGVTEELKVEMVECRSLSNYDSAIELVKAALETQRTWPSEKTLRTDLQLALNVLISNGD